MNRIVLINPPTPDSFQANRDFMGGFGATNAKGITKVPPTMLESVAGILKSKGHDIETIDAAVERSAENLYKKLEGCKVIGSYCATATFDEDITFLEGLKKRFNTYTFMFGPQVSVTPEYAMNRSNLDAVVIGEPEYTVLELIEALTLNRSNDLGAIKGLEWRKKGVLTKNPGRELESDLDKLPYPYRNLENINKYYYKENEAPFISVYSSRGCPYSCMYCPYPVSQGTKFRSRSPENVIAELETVKKEIDFKMVLFRDPVFTFNRERTIKLCNLIKRQNWNIVWRCETTTSNVDEELLNIMKNSGCAGINFGIETGSPKLIEKYASKTGGLEHIRKIFKICHGLDIYTIGFFIVGLPGETKETIKDTLNFAIELDPVDINFTTASPFPGTKFHDHLVQKGIIKGDEYGDFKTSNAISIIEGMSGEELQQEIINMYVKFYFRPRRLFFEFKRHPFVFIKKSLSMLFLLKQKRPSMKGSS